MTSTRSMKRFVVLTASATLAGCVPPTARQLPAPAGSAEPAAAAAEWKLVWSDEFDVDGRPNPLNWGYEAGFVRNREDQWYQPENAWCEGGRLVIEARRERRENPRYDSTSADWKASRRYAEYTSTSLVSRGKQAWQYGRFEMRGRIDIRQGLWPAWWTLGVQGAWPGNGEIDIMEYYRGMLLANFAWGSDRRSVAKWDALEKPVTDFGPDWSKEFHVWRMDWDAEKIRLYVDDVLLNTVHLSETINGDAEGKNPFHQPHYMILNLAIGGANGGDPAPTAFPARFEVDYVRVYQR